MVDVFTSTTSNADEFMATALDLHVQWYLKDIPCFRQFYDVKPVHPAHEGKVVSVTLHGELTEAITPLTETADVDARDIPDPRQVSVTMNEYGDANLRTALLELTSWNKGIPSDIVELLGDSMNRSMDTLARTPFDSSSNVWFYDNDGTLDATLPADGELNPADATSISSVVAALRARRAAPRDGKFYTGVLHPLVSHDVRREAGANSWLSPHQYVDTAEIYAGETGEYAGARIVESTRCRVQTAQGSGSTTVFTSYFFGREAGIEAVKVEPHSVIGPVTDKLLRHKPVGWYGLLGWNRFRENSQHRLLTESSLGATVDLSGYVSNA